MDDEFMESMTKLSISSRCDELRTLMGGMEYTQFVAELAEWAGRQKDSRRKRGPRATGDVAEEVRVKVETKIKELRKGMALEQEASKSVAGS